MFLYMNERSNLAKRRVLLYGSSLHLEGVRTSLQSYADLDVTSVDEESPNALQSILACHPDVVVFDSSGGKPDWALELANHRSAIVLIGVDPAQDHALVLYSRRPQVLTMHDLVQAINASPISAPPPSLWQVCSTRVRRLTSQITLRYTRRQKLAFALVPITAFIILTILLLPTDPQANAPLAGTAVGKLAPEVEFVFAVGILLGALLIGLFLQYKRHKFRGNIKHRKGD